MTALLLGAILQQNLIPNPGFAQGRDGVPVGWSPQTWGGSAVFGSAAGVSGGAVTVSSGAGADAAWTAVVRVRPYSKYKFSAQIKTEGVEPVSRGLGALVNLHGRPERTEAVVGTRGWTRVGMTIDTGADDSLQINCLLGYFGTAKGSASFSDLSLQLIETRDLHPAVEIDGTKRLPPISKYIYSQFIEHLGRCIYGGIWAEMLDDRKFYYEPGSKESAWKKFGDDGVIWSDTQPLNGRRCVELFSEDGTAGIRQSGLWLERGRAYSGYVWLRAKSAIPRTRVRLNWGSGAANSATVQLPASSGKWTKHSFRFVAGATTKDGSFDLFSDGQLIDVGGVSLMPADHVKGMRRDVLALLKQLNAPLYRWPGGNFVSGYDWRDGIGDRDSRPPRKNPAWEGIEHNDFGTHEFMDFCKEVGAEPLVVVNSGLGDASSAAAWVEYINGSDTTPEGSRRARNGRKSPWKVQWWGIGNEMYGSWQLGHMPLAQYIVKHGLFFDAMKRADPSIRTIAVGDVGPWSLRMLTECAGQMDYISEHFYCQERQGVMAHVAQVPNAIRAKVAAHRRYRDTLPSLKGKDIKIAMDEWNYWYGPHHYGELGTRYFVKDGLGIAAGLHEFFRSTDIVGMAQYAQTVNVIGAIKTTPTAAALETTGLVLKLYRQQFGVVPLQVSGAPEPLDVSAALTADGKNLTLGIVNPTGEEVSLACKVAGLSQLGSIKGWEIASEDPMAYNTPGETQRVTIRPVAPKPFGGKIVVRPYSVTLLVL